MCQWVAVAFAGDARCNCTWDAIGPLKPGERRSDGHPNIGPPRQTFALANVHATILSKAPYESDAPGALQEKPGQRALSVTMALGLLRRSKSPMLSCVGPVEVSTSAAILKKSSHGGRFNLLVFGRQRGTRPST